ncbi:MAG: hypothetical protein R2807_11515 [Chitinophagales bacterium]
MKNQISKSIMLFAITLCTFFSIAACKKDKTETSGKTGTFTIDGTSYTGNTETQTFVNDNYSIVCQSDEPYKFIQITFHNKAEAEAGGTFDVEDYSLNVSSGSVQLGTSDIITADPTSSKTIAVSGKKISINNVTIQSTSSSATTTINSANINF